MSTKTYGDLIVSMTKTYTQGWDDKGSGATRDVSFYSTSLNDLRPLGDVATGSHTSINDKIGTLLVGQNPASSNKAVAEPTDWKLVWKDQKSKAKQDGSVWEPVAPSGYVALGHVSNITWNKPTGRKIWCVRKDLVGDGQFVEPSVWDDKKSGASENCSIWNVEPIPTNHGSEKIPILANTFISVASHSKPQLIPKVLLLPVENDFTKFSAPLPDLDPNDLPSTQDVYDKMEQCRVTLPYVAFFKPDDLRCLENIAKPFCVITREISWIVAKVFQNKGSSTIHESTTITTGVSDTQASEMTHSAGVEISSSFGILAASFEVSLSYQFTSSNSTSYTEYQEGTRTRDFDVLPYTGLVVFMKHIWMKGTRSDGSVVTAQIEFDANEEMHLRTVELDKRRLVLELERSML